MATCPNKRKTSDLADDKDQGSSRKHRDWISHAGLVELQGCSERTIREWCDRGLIPGACQTVSGHRWRIPWPLSMITRLRLEMRRKDWPFRGMDVIKTGKDFMRVFEPERAEWLMLARVYERSINEDVPVPYSAEFGDYPEPGLLENPPDEKAKIAKEFQDEIVRRVENKEPVSDMILIGEVYQWIYKFSPVDLDCPTARQMAGFMRISRQAFYRLYPNARKKIEKAYFILFGHQSKRELVDLYGRDAVLKQNIKAKKPGIGSLHNDPDDDDEPSHPRRI